MVRVGRQVFYFDLGRVGMFDPRGEGERKRNSSLEIVRRFGADCFNESGRGEKKEQFLRNSQVIWSRLGQSESGRG